MDDEGDQREEAGNSVRFSQPGQSRSLQRQGSMVQQMALKGAAAPSVHFFAGCTGCRQTARSALQQHRHLLCLRRRMLQFLPLRACCLKALAPWPAGGLLHTCSLKIKPGLLRTGNLTSLQTHAAMDLLQIVTGGADNASVSSGDRNSAGHGTLETDEKGAAHECGSYLNFSMLTK